MADLYLIVGLGNPGKQYENTRHNVGFMAADELARRHGLAFGKIEHKAQVASGTILGRRVLLAKPQTFMNVSGDSVVPLAHFYKVPPEHILLMHDELDVPAGTLRVRANGSSGGQNGVKHILQRLGTQEVARVRIGIGRPPGRMNPADWVLTPYKGNDAIDAANLVSRAANAAELWLTDGIEIAMTRSNGTGEAPQTKQTPLKTDEG